MGMLGHKIPGYIYEKSNIVRLILLTAFFALVFINIYKPFSSSNWYRVSEFSFCFFQSDYSYRCAGGGDQPDCDVLLGQETCHFRRCIFGVDYSGDIFHVFVLYDLHFGTESGAGVFKRFQRVGYQHKPGSVVALFSFTFLFFLSGERTAVEVAGRGSGRGGK